MTGVPHGSRTLARLVDQMSKAPNPSGRLEANTISSPSLRTLGIASSLAVASSATRVRGPKLPSARRVLT